MCFVESVLCGEPMNVIEKPRQRKFIEHRLKMGYTLEQQMEMNPSRGRRAQLFKMIHERDNPDGKIDSMTKEFYNEVGKTRSVRKVWEKFGRGRRYQEGIERLRKNPLEKYENRIQYHSKKDVVE